MLLFLSDHNETWIFSTDFKKILKYKILWKIHPLGADLSHVDRHDEANGPFPNFANVPKINQKLHYTKVLTWLSDKFIIMEISKKERKIEVSVYAGINTTGYMWIKIQLYATVCRYLFTAKLLYMFRVSQHPSSAVLKTVPTTSSTGHTTCTATPLLCGLIWTT